MLRSMLCLLVTAGFLAAAVPELCLPTENHHLFSGEPEKFFMYVDRTVEGVASKPWEGGTFGFVRTPVKVNGETVCRQFHEGIDISPVRRDKAGNPLDLVGSIAAGTVAHISPASGDSNYGKYVVVEHRWENSAVCSLYAHLAEITCQPGDAVQAGDPLGRMGYTGAGINRTRAHLHLELGLLLSARYEDWHQATGKGINRHGIYNGMNLAGSEVSRFFTERAKNPELKFSEFVAATPVYFKVAVPAKGTPELAQRYPWLLPPAPAAPASAAVPLAWEIHFSATGLPVRIVPSQRQVSAPVIVQVRPAAIPHRYLTRNLVTGVGGQAALTQSGQQLVALLMGDFPCTEVQAARPPPAVPKKG
ncbi:MAG: hypothetical protein RLZZ522_1983 [Verrucomicrobiota bacterium]